MDRLSPELLLEIFDLVVHSGDDSYSGFPKRPPTQNNRKPSRRFVRNDEHPKYISGISAHETNATSPIHLNHVCQVWRYVAFSQSKLWSTIYVTHGRPGYVKLLELWLERSRDRESLLKIVFRDGGETTANMSSDDEEEFGEDDEDGWGDDSDDDVDMVSGEG